MIDWTKSMQQTFEYYTVNPDTWRDDKKLTNITKSTIDRDESSETLGSASIEAVGAMDECYVRIYLIASQNEKTHREPLGTVLVQTPETEFDGMKTDVTMDAYTPLIELKENPPPVGYSILKNENVMDNAYRIMREHMRAPIIRSKSDDKLYNDFVANTDDTWLTFCSDLTANAKMNLGLDEMGRVIFLPEQDIASLQPVHTYDDGNCSILYPSFKISRDLYGVPNVVEVVYSQNEIWQKYLSSSVDFCNEGYGTITVNSSEWDVTITKECDVCFVVNRNNNAEITDIAQAYDIITISKQYNYKRIDNLEKSVSELTTDTVLLKENKCDYPSILKKQNIDILDGIIRDDGVLVNIQDSTNKHIEISINSHYDKGSVCVSGSCLWKNNMPFLLFLNDSGEVLETYGYDTGKFYENYVIDSVPVGCTKIVVNCQTEVGYLQYLLKTNLSVEEYINNKLEDSKTKNDSYWTGKKIVWFGTSIPAGVVNAGESGGNGSYPVRIGEMLGATVYNESVGSSAVRIGMHDAITNDDINGYSGCPATCCLFSLSGTVDEKKEIISNWSTWKNKFSIGVETIDSIISRGEEQEQIYDRSYEVKLSKYLSGGSVGQCDLYVIDHGYNDAGNNNGNDYSDLKSIPSDTLDRTYFIGAMNYIINKIKTDNFRASICIVSHYNDEGVFSNLVEAQRYVADYWNIPFIEIYDKIGFSTSSKITINGVTKTVKDWWLTDGIHPSSDTTGKALRHYAEVLYPLIRDVR